MRYALRELIDTVLGLLVLVGVILAFVSWAAADTSLHWLALGDGSYTLPAVAYVGVWVAVVSAVVVRSEFDDEPLWRAVPFAVGGVVAFLVVSTIVTVVAEGA